MSCVHREDTWNTSLDVLRLETIMFYGPTCSSTGTLSAFPVSPGTKAGSPSPKAAPGQRRERLCWGCFLLSRPPAELPLSQPWARANSWCGEEGDSLRPLGSCAVATVPTSRKESLRTGSLGTAEFVFALAETAAPLPHSPSSEQTPACTRRKIPRWKNAPPKPDCKTRPYLWVIDGEEVNTSTSSYCGSQGSSPRSKVNNNTNKSLHYRKIQNFPVYFHEVFLQGNNSLVNSIKQSSTEWKIISLEYGQNNNLGTFTGQVCVPILKVLSLDSYTAFYK